MTGEWQPCLSESARDVSDSTISNLAAAEPGQIYELKSAGAGAGFGENLI